MTTLTSNARTLPTPSRLVTALQTFAAEVSAFLQAIASPRAVIRDVEAMGSLLKQATRIEATEPIRAAALRRQASLTGLR